MIKHIVAWNFKEEISQEENCNNAKKVKEELEGLKAKIKEIRTIEVIIEALKSGSFDVILVSEFDSIETLQAYQIHEEHLRVSSFAGSVLRNRKCIDYEI
ncbi:Dabb family protein [Cellulosilyticum sp. ST5]|uniref:Dabb family protein n=1 Tax=Cellulosilyticum sp. ST5 TaxID=3055805 RepID=UPI0039775AFF